MIHEFIIILIAVFSFSVYCFKFSDGDTQLKIIGGLSVTNKSDFAYQVSLRYGMHHLCGGSIISKTLILTAAHCCFHEGKPLKKQNLRVFAGDLNIRNNSTETESRAVTRVYVHPGYDEEYIQNDIAIWKVAPPFTWNKNIQPIEITNRKILANTRCNVSGWGVTDYKSNKVASNLKYVEVPIIQKSLCQKYYPEIVSLNVICAGLHGKDSCQGDSGGALVCNRSLTGIVSYGEGCGIYPGVYTDVYAYRFWIKKSARIINSGSHNNPMYIDIMIIFTTLLLSISKI